MLNCCSPLALRDDFSLAFVGLPDFLLALADLSLLDLPFLVELGAEPSGG